MLLTKEQIAELTEEQCQKELKKLDKAYSLDKPITAEVWPMVDEVANTLLYLDDHIKHLGQLDNIAAAGQARWKDK